MFPLFFVFYSEFRNKILISFNIQEAMNVVYNSQLYEKVLDLETGLYYQSSEYNYELLHEELLNGKIA